MRNAQKPDHVSLDTLIGRIREGQYVIPDFQREFDWKPWDIRELVRSIFLDYYIGSLLLWKGKEENFRALSCEPIYGFNGSEEPRYIVLDGQQRLTAMHYAFIAPDVALPKYSKRIVYFVNVEKFINEEYDDAFYHTGFTKKAEKLFNDRAQQFQTHQFPTAVIGEEGWGLSDWCKYYEKYWYDVSIKEKDDGNLEAAREAEKFTKNAKLFSEHMKGITGQYQISYIELDQELQLEKICDIFTQINSRGVGLSVFDLMNAMLTPRSIHLKQMWRSAEGQLEFAQTDKMNVYILQIMSILKQNYCSPKFLYYLLPGQKKMVRDKNGVRGEEILVSSPDEFRALWEKAVNAMTSSLITLQNPHEYGVSSSKYLPYVTILPIFSAIQQYVKTLPPSKQLLAQRKISKWYWASVFLQRYSGSVESKAARDYIQLKAWLNDDEAELDSIEEFERGFVNIDMRKEVKKGSAIYNATFNLFVLAGAPDWVTGKIAHPSDLDDHHIVPYSWGKEHLTGNEINTILNRTPLTAETNRMIIRDKLPNEYLPDLIKENGEPMVLGILEKHFISSKALEVLLRNPFTPDDYEDFILERQRSIQFAIEDLLVKERLDLPPNLRKLDSKIEVIERSLRNLITNKLDGDSSKLPSQIYENASKRIKSALRRNAAMESARYELLEGILEYTDLRDLQNTIVNKSLWSIFENKFGNKVALENRFSQLTELRNSIAHNRTVDEVTLKDGEASLLWFSAVFKIEK